MKNFSRKLLFLAFISGWIIQVKAQNVTQIIDNKRHRTLHKGLSELVDFQKAKIAINVKNFDDYSKYTFRNANREVKVEIIPANKSWRLRKALKKFDGVSIISENDKAITCWVMISRLNSLVTKQEAVAAVRPFSSNPDVFLSKEARKKPMTRNADGTTNFGIWEADSEEEEREEKEEGTWWSEERDLYEFNLLKDPATGKVPRNAPILASDAALKAKNFKPFVQGLLTGAELTVVPEVANNLGGRTRAIGIDVRNSQIMMAGSVSSGLYRSTNGGTTWTRVAPIGQIHNITAIAQDPRSGFQDTWYYGTGESVGNSASLGTTYFGNGIWKSIDNGITWAPLAATISILESFSSRFDFVHRIIVEPNTGDVYAATSNVISRSTDGGTTWTTALGSFANGRYTDIIVTPTGRFYASFDGRDSNEGVWTSTTGASGSWTKIAGTISAVRTPAAWHAFNTYGRIVMAYAPSNPDVVFFLYWNGTASSCGSSPLPEAKLFKFVQSTGAFTDLSANLPDEAGCSDGNDPFAVQTGYDLLITVKPNDENTIYIGGTNLYRSTSGFTNTAATTRIGGYNSPAGYALYPNHHPDQHLALFAAGDNNTLYSGNDGGIHKADATASNVVWTSLNNNYVTYQYYNTDIDPANGSVALLGGAQDNGTTTVQSGSNFSSVFGGDGCGVGIISYASSNSFNILASSQSGNIVRLTAPSSGFSIKPTGLVSSAFVTTFNLDQDNTNYLYFAGGAVLYRTRIASTISGGAVSGSATGWEILPAGISGNIQSWSTSRNDGYGGAAYTVSDLNRKLYIGTTTGKVYRLNDPAFTSSAAVEISPAIISPATTLGVCSSIAVNPFDDNEIIVTFANYGVRSVFHTFNANVATPVWTEVEGPAAGPVALGSARASVITKIGATKTYLVGNTTGLYSTQALTGATTVWDRVGTNEINYAVAANMRLRPSDNRIVLGTHGNGMFELQLAAAVNVSSQPMSVTACETSNVSFAVVAVGVSAYKWQISPDSNPANFVDLTIAAPYTTTNGGATLNIASITSSLTGFYYRCVLTDVLSIVSSSSSALLTVANPVDPTSVMASSSNICLGGSVSLTSSCSIGTVVWYDVATGGTQIGSGSPLLLNPIANSTYYSSCKAGVCESARVATSPVSIITMTNPTAVSASSTEICNGNSLSISATCADAGAVVNWYITAVGGSVLGTGSPLSHSPTVNTRYYASCQGVGSCESNRVASSLVIVLLNLNTPTAVTQVNLKGTLSTSDLLYNKALVFAIGSSCSLDPEGSVFNYKKHTFTLNAPSVVVASLLDADGATISPGGADSFLTLYSTFDPLNPCNNIVGINDDAGDAFLSKITTNTIPAGTYTVVVSSYDPGASANLPWTYSLAIKTSTALLALASPPTLLKVDGVTSAVTVNNGTSVTLTATCNEGTLTWYDSMVGGVALGTGSPFVATPAFNKSYYATCKNSCSETARVATQFITVNGAIVPTISTATLVGVAFCAGTNIDVTFSTTGTFGGGNQFNVLLSDANGSFTVPTIIGTSNAAGTVVCTTPLLTVAGENYRVQVVSTDPLALGNINIAVLTVHPVVSNLTSPSNDLSSATATKRAIQTINAANDISGLSIIQYKAGNGINLTPGFKVVPVSGSSFQAEISGCSN